MYGTAQRLPLTSGGGTSLGRRVFLAKAFPERTAQVARQARRLKSEERPKRIRETNWETIFFIFIELVIFKKGAGQGFFKGRRDTEIGMRLVEKLKKAISAILTVSRLIGVTLILF